MFWFFPSVPEVFAGCRQADFLPCPILFVFTAVLGHVTSVVSVADADCVVGQEGILDREGKPSRGARLVVQGSVHSHIFKAVGPRRPHLLRKSSERVVQTRAFFEHVVARADAIRCLVFVPSSCVSVKK